MEVFHTKVDHGIGQGREENVCDPFVLQGAKLLV